MPLYAISSNGRRGCHQNLEYFELIDSAKLNYNWRSSKKGYKMESSDFSIWYKKGNFDAQKASLIPKKRFLNLSYYTIIYVLADSNGEVLITNESEQTRTAFAYTDRPSNKQFIIEFTIGELSRKLSKQRTVTFIKINPVTNNANEINQCEEIIYCPLFDEMSKQKTITSLHHTLPLLAIDDHKVSTMNFEAIYGFFREADLPQETEERTSQILKMIDFINFVVARTPIKFGSSSVMCIFLDFENPIEENQFIQEYSLLDTYSNVIFVNSELEIINSYRQKINYDGDKMETILLPIIDWQKKNNNARQELL